MTKQNYIAVAEQVRHAENNDEPVMALARRLSIIFKRENPRFDEETFLKACGYKFDGQVWTR